MIDPNMFPYTRGYSMPDLHGGSGRVRPRESGTAEGTPGSRRAWDEYQQRHDQWSGIPNDSPTLRRRTGTPRDDRVFRASSSPQNRNHGNPYENRNLQNQDSMQNQNVPNSLDNPFRISGIDSRNLPPPLTVHDAVANTLNGGLFPPLDMTSPSGVDGTDVDMASDSNSPPFIRVDTPTPSVSPTPITENNAAVSYTHLTLPTKRIV